jgi:hypothetical protein
MSRTVGETGEIAGQEATIIKISWDRRINPAPPVEGGPAAVPSQGKDLALEAQLRDQAVAQYPERSRGFFADREFPWAFDWDIAH